jgi:uncharacterized protein with GYD domain
MPTYIVLGKYTKEGITNIKDSPQRVEQAKKLATSRGGAIKEFYYTMGRYDFVTVVEATGNEGMMESLFIIGSGGAVMTETLVAIPLEKGVEIFKKMP